MNPYVVISFYIICQFAASWYFANLFNGESLKLDGVFINNGMNISRGKAKKHQF
ncbi:MAG: hypothetical protein ACD_26C00162G0001 [uncultured bacterium]|nr:MAG: hypothetical protein ACD_26C00162G0001 [uncultured bacterium]